MRALHRHRAQRPTTKLVFRRASTIAKLVFAKSQSWRLVLPHCSIKSRGLIQFSGSRAFQPSTFAPEPVRYPRHRAIISFRGCRSSTKSYSVDKDIIVKLKWGDAEYRGRLVSMDLYMNIQLKNTEEFIDGRSSGTLGQVLIRCAV